ncbi:hypothetical protein [Roseomonas sp. AR75]|uniref:hypothetical protein n=1 Tax=Roseomonas sp. AR75 TaxID=2562311 RepID=UPI0014856D90|nr:hypothetical protein [Roseomonas sp. AR75]
MGRGVRIIAWCYGIVAGLALVVGFPLSALLSAAGPRGGVSTSDAGVLFLLAAAILLAPAVLGAVGTLRDRHWGPIALGYVAALILFLPPVGTVVGAVTLWILFPAIRAGWARQRDANAAHAAAQLGAATSTDCAHLQPIEGAMRRAGIALRSSPWGRTQAACTIDLLALARRFGPLGPVSLSEPTPGERQAPGDPRALLWCQACRQGIEVVAPSRAPPGTRIFPGPAAT